MSEEEHHQDCGHFREEDEDCNRHPWHGLLYVTEVKTGREILVSSALILEKRNRTGLLVTSGNIISQEILNTDNLNAMGYALEIRFCHDVIMAVKKIIRHPDLSSCEQKSSIINNNIAVILAELPELNGDIPDLVPVCRPPFEIQEPNSEEVIITQVGQKIGQSNLSSQPVIDAELFAKTVLEKDRVVNVTRRGGEFRDCNSFDETGDIGQICVQAGSRVCVRETNSSDSVASLDEVLTGSRDGNFHLFGIRNQGQESATRISFYLPWINEQYKSWTNTM